MASERELHSPVRMVEGAYGDLVYHLAMANTNGSIALCGKRTMASNAKLESWGYVSGHVGKRCCWECDKAAHQLFGGIFTNEEFNDPAVAVKGQEAAKRAVIVAAAGSHSLLLVGPKDCGKTMLRAVASRLGVEEVHERRSCPCGNRNDPRLDCRCSIEEIELLESQFPITDMAVEVPPVPRKYLESRLPGTTLAEMWAKISQKGDRVGPVAVGDLRRPQRNLFRQAIEELWFGKEEQQKILDVARTIANVDRRAEIEAENLIEAIHYSYLGL